MCAASDSGLVEDLCRGPGPIKKRSLAVLRSGYRVVSTGRSSSLNCEAETLFIGDLENPGTLPLFPVGEVSPGTEGRKE